MNQLTLGGNVDMPRNTYPEDFETFWRVYPARSGGNPKRAAYKAWNARIKEGFYAVAMIDGAGRYARWCDVMEQTGTPYVMQASTFLGPNWHFMEDYAPPPRKRPQTTDEWMALADEMGLEGKRGESMAAFKKRISQMAFGK